MAPTYRECPACGKHALRIATRCPRCGTELLTQPIRSEVTRPVARRAGRLLAAVMVMAGIGVVMTLRRQVAGDGNANEHGQMTVAAQTLPVAAPQVVLGRTTAAALDTMVVPPDSLPSPDAVPRVAKTWTKVHVRRSVKADLVAVLLPGDTVLVDSLRGSWWRVALEGRVIGYVYAGTLMGD